METLRKLFANAWFIGIASIASIASLIFGFYAFFISREIRELAFYPDPATAVLVKSGQTSKLAVTFDGMPVTTDITVAQVSIWNEGKLPIQRDNILKPIVISTGEDAPILEATLRKSTRDVTDIRLDNTELQKGRLGISWKILEQADGALIQLIYAGSPNRKITLEGVIQRPVKFTEITGKLSSVNIFISIAIGLLAGLVPQLIVNLFKVENVNRKLVVSLIMLVPAMGLSYLIVHWTTEPLKPPETLVSATGAPR